MQNIADSDLVGNTGDFGQRAGNSFRDREGDEAAQQEGTKHKYYRQSREGTGLIDCCYRHISCNLIIDLNQPIEELRYIQGSLACLQRRLKYVIVQSGYPGIVQSHTACDHSILVLRQVTHSFVRPFPLFPCRNEIFPDSCFFVCLGKRRIDVPCLLTAFKCCIYPRILRLPHIGLHHALIDETAFANPD